MVSINWSPTPRDLRNFGWICLAGFGLLGLLARLKSWETASLVLWSLALAIWILGLLAPGLLRPVYLGWMVLAWPIGWLVSHVLLGLVFFSMFTLAALAFRVLGRDPLARRGPSGASSYWVPKRQPGRSESARYFRQY